MSYQERLTLYRDIESSRGRPLICYITSIRPQASGGIGAQIAGDVIPELIKQINLVSAEHQELDFLVVSNGGDPIAAARVISLLRERFKKVSVLIPYVAYSGATLLALGADEIVMHPFSNLGPVDPQLIVPSAEGGAIAYGAEDLRNFISFVREVGISDQEEMARAFELLTKEVGAVRLGVANRSSHLMQTLGEKLLSLHLKDNTQAKTIAETLSRSYHHHGYPLGPSDAESIGLPVVRATDELEMSIWQVWEDLEQEMECNKVFYPLEVVLSDPNAASLLCPVTQVQLPTNIPPQLLQQAYNQVLQQIGIVAVPPVDFELFLATLESVRGKSESRFKGKVNAVRQPDMNIAVSIMQVSQGWSFTKTELAKE